MGDLKISSRYRTIHSIGDQDVLNVLGHVNRTGAKLLLDFGCHTGHLAINLALDNDVTVYAVDNFVGSNDDPLMTNTVQKITNGTGNFMDVVKHNIEEARGLSPHGYAGTISLMYPDEFFEAAKDLPQFDFAFIDAGHTEAEIWQCKKILSLVKVGGIISGHDNCERSWPFVKRAVDELRPYCSVIDNGYTWFFTKERDAE